MLHATALRCNLKSYQWQLEATSRKEANGRALAAAGAADRRVEIGAFAEALPRLGLFCRIGQQCCPIAITAPCNARSVHIHIDSLAETNLIGRC
jgi:hypothetical protein